MIDLSQIKAGTLLQHIILEDEVVFVLYVISNQFGNIVYCLDRHTNSGNLVTPRIIINRDFWRQLD